MFWTIIITPLCNSLLLILQVLELKSVKAHHEIYIILLNDLGEFPVIWILEVTLKIGGLLYQTLEGIEDKRFQNRLAGRETGSVPEDRPVPPGPQNIASLDISVVMTRW